MKTILWCVSIVVLAVACDNPTSTPTPDTPPPQAPPTTTTIPTTPILTTHISHTSIHLEHHHVTWTFTIVSPIRYDHGFVTARWYDAEGFQIVKSVWSGVIRDGTHTYTEEVVVDTDVWRKVVEWVVVIDNWYN